MNLYKFTVLLEPQREDGETYFLIRVPALPEIISQGDSVEEALFMAQDALELVVLSRLEEGEPIPADRKPSKVPKGTVVREVLVSVTHGVNTKPLTEDVKMAFA